MEERGYVVVSLLGHGGQGRVYEVKDRQGRLCVIKQMPMLAERDRETAVHEVRLLSSLRHPCIVPYLDNFLAKSMPSMPTEDVICLVMSKCEHDLRHECLRTKALGQRFDEPRAVSWLAQLCWGLNHLHARKFLHRDLKPQNVLLTASGRALLADFGVAGQIEHSQDFRKSVVGTFSCMSPEMLEGRPYGIKTDQWALGCVLYEIMALEAPFAGCESYAAIVVAVLQAKQLCAPPGYSEELSRTLEALLAHKPDARPSNAELLGRPLLSHAFRALLESSADEVRENAAAAVSDEEGEDYDSDFESCSESDPESSSCRRATLHRAGSDDVGLEEWGQLYVEAEALLQPVPATDPVDELRKVRSVLQRTGLGAQGQVDEALEFLRDRRPLWEASDVDEDILQIEIVEQFGDEGLHALPLLERCIALECG